MDDNDWKPDWKPTAETGGSSPSVQTKISFLFVHSASRIPCPYRDGDISSIARSSIIGCKIGTVWFISDVWEEEAGLLTM